MYSWYYYQNDGEVDYIRPGNSEVVNEFGLGSPINSIFLLPTYYQILLLYNAIT